MTKIYGTKEAADRAAERLRRQGWLGTFPEAENKVWSVTRRPVEPLEGIPEPPPGIYGTSISEQILGLQLELNRLMVEEPEAYQEAVTQNVIERMNRRQLAKLEPPSISLKEIEELLGAAKDQGFKPYVGETEVNTVTEWYLLRQAGWTDVPGTTRMRPPDWQPRPWYRRLWAWLRRPL